MTWPQQLSLTGTEITSTSRKTGSYQEVAHHSKGMKLTFKAWRWSSHSRHNYLRRGGCCSLNFPTNLPSFSNPPILYFSLTNPPIHLRSPLFAPGERLPTKLRRSCRHHQLPCSRLLQASLWYLASFEQYLKKTYIILQGIQDQPRGQCCRNTRNPDRCQWQAKNWHLNQISISQVAIQMTAMQGEIHGRWTKKCRPFQHTLVDWLCNTKIDYIMQLLCAVLAECFYTGASITFKAIKCNTIHILRHLFGPLHPFIFLRRSLGDFPLSREEHGRWMDLLYV